MKPEYPIAKYGITGNCETAALVNSNGGIDWLCLPGFDARRDRESAGSFALALSVRPPSPLRRRRIRHL